MKLIMKNWADKNEPNLVEGEAYLDEKNQKMVIQGVEKKVSINTSEIPLQKLVLDWNLSKKVFRFMVDSVLGDDDNDGLSWDKPKKTINGIMAGFPLDLETYSIHILIKDGSEFADTDMNNFHNGNVHFHWCGIWLETQVNSPVQETQDFIAWAKNGSDITFGDLPIVFKAVENNFAFLGYTISDSHFTLNFVSNQIGLASHESGWGYANRFVFKSEYTAESEGDCLLGTQNSHLWATSLKFEMGNMRYGLSIHAQASAWLPVLEFYGGTGSGSTTTSMWRGAIYSYAPTEKLKFGDIAGHAFVNGYTPKLDGYYFEDIANAITVIGGINGLNMSQLKAIQYADVTKTYLKTRIMFSNSSYGYYAKYNKNYCTLVESGSLDRKVFEIIDNQLTEILTQGVKQVGTNILFTLPITDPHVVGALWVDAGAVKSSLG